MNIHMQKRVTDKLWVKDKEEKGLRIHTKQTQQSQGYHRFVVTLKEEWHCETFGNVTDLFVSTQRVGGRAG